MTKNSHEEVQIFPEYFSNSKDVMDAFLSQFALKISTINEKLISSAIEAPKLSSKRKIDKYQNRVCENLKKFNSKSSDIFPQILTFSSLATSNPSKVLESILKFCPVILGSQSLPNDTEKTILSFFPSITSLSSDLAYIVGFFSDCIFSILAQMVFEPITAPDDSVLIPVLDRIFNRESLPPPHSFAFRIFSYALNSYKPVVSRICTTSFVVFSSYYTKYFPNKKRDDAYLMSFMIASSGILFNEQNYHLISELSNPLLKLFLDCSDNEDVLSTVIEFFCNFLPNIKGLKVKNLVSSIEKRAESLLKTPNYCSAMKLIGVVHYIKSPNSLKKRTKFIENKVFKYFDKSNKQEAALNYLVSYFKPNDDVPLNWSPYSNQFVNTIFPKLIPTSFTGLEDQAATLIEYMAAIDLPTFISKWLPLLLDDSSSCVVVTLYALNKILNPMSGFQTIAGTVPTNATANIRFHMTNIIEQIKKYMKKQYKKSTILLTKIGYDYISPSEMLDSIPLPTIKLNLNQYDLSPQVLYFLFVLPKSDLIHPLSRILTDELEKSEKVTQSVLKQWKESFETPYDYYGDIFDEFHLPYLNDIEFHYSKDSCLLPLLPIVFHFTTDYTEISQPLIQMIVSDDIVVSATASIIYELLCICFRSHVSFFLNELYDVSIVPHRLSAAQLHQIYLIFSRCMKFLTPELDSSIFQKADTIGFIALNSPFPETRKIGTEIIKNSTLLFHFSLNEIPSFYTFWHQNKGIIELKVMKSVVSAFSSLAIDNIPTYKLPTIQLNMICLSPYLLIWKYSLIEISKALQKTPKMTKFLMHIRNTLIENAKFFVNPNESNLFLSVVGYNELVYFSNNYIFLVSTLSIFAEGLTKEEQIEWKKQNEAIATFIDSLVLSCFKMKINVLPLFSFVIASVHISSLTSLIEKFIIMLEGKELKVGQKDSLLELMSLVLRRFSMQVEFTDYLGGMIQNRICNSIFRFCDTRIDLFTKIDEDLSSYIRQMTDYLIFRSQYFKYLHHTRLERPHGPIPRVSYSNIIDESEISPIVNKVDFFNILLKWSLYKSDSSTLYRIFGHVCETALTYLVSLVDLFDNPNVFTLDFLSCCSTISVQNPSFLKHLLTHHFKIFFDKYLHAAFTTPLEIGIRFFKAIASQFIISVVKDSLIHSFDTFTANVTTMFGKKLTTDETEFVNCIYLRTGKIILLGLFFMLHPNLNIRHSAMKLIAEIIPIITLIHDKGDTTKALKLCCSIRENVSFISSSIAEVRSFNTCEFSAELAKAAKFCTEQFLNEAFNLISEIPSTRRSLTRYELLQIISPWMKNIKFDLVNRFVVENPCRFFIFFSPSEFVTKLCRCTTTLPFNLEMWKYLVEGNDNIEFLTLALVDYVIINLKSKNFILEVFTFFYRIGPFVIANSIVPFLQFDNWYYQNIQLGKFEEIPNFNALLFGKENQKETNDDNENNDDDDEEYETEWTENNDEHKESLKTSSTNSIISSENTNNSKNNNVKENDQDDNSNDGYLLTVELALDAITLFAKDDVVPLFDSLAIITAFCMTHLKMKKSMICLSQIVSSLKNTYDINVPKLLDDVSNFLEYLLTNSKYESLTFVKEINDSPMKEFIESKRVSITNLILDLTNVFTSFQNSFIKEIVKSLQIWGLGCGDLKVAAIALDLYGIFINQKDPIIHERIKIPPQNIEKLQYNVKSIVESTCVIIRCFMSSKIKQSTVVSVSTYLNSVIQVLYIIYDNYKITMKSISKIKGNGNENDLDSNVFNLIVLMFDIGEPLANSIIVGALKLIQKLLEKIKIDNEEKKTFSKVNFNKILISALISPKIEFNEICDFLSVISSLPKELLTNSNDFSVFITAIFPSLYSSLGDKEKLLKFDQIITNLVPKLDSQTSRVLSDIETFSNKDKKEFAMVILSNFTIRQMIQTASIFSQMIEKKKSDTDFLNSIYEISTYIIEICHSSEVLEKLAPVTSRAILDQKPETLSSQSKYIDFIVSLNLNFMIKQTNSASFSEIDIMSQDADFSEIYNDISKELHLELKNSERIQIEFSKSIQLLPPIFPFLKAFYRNPHLDEITELCRRVEVLLFTKRADCINKAQNLGDIISENQIPLKLCLNLPFQKLIDAMIEEIARENEEEESNEVYKKNALKNKDNADGDDKNLPKLIKDADIAVEKDFDGDDSINDILKFVPTNLSTFLPTIDYCNEIVSSVTNRKLQAMLVT